MKFNEPIGVEFMFSNTYDAHLSKVFESISVEDYTWYVACSENYVSYNGKLESFLPNGIYSGNEFASIIKSFSKYTMMLIRLLAVPIGKEIDQDRVNDYDDYIKSNAEIALLCADKIVDLYVKNSGYLQKIFESCKYYYGSEEVKPGIITLKNDGRTGFWV